MNIYYVYQYLREKDSKTAPAGTPYYVGKGHKERGMPGIIEISDLKIKIAYKLWLIIYMKTKHLNLK